MIKVDIDRKNVEKALNEKESEIKSSLSSIEHNLSSNNKPNFKEQLYRKAKKPLIEEWSRKCFYCERLRATGELQIEHYRPKGRLHENNEHCGYWWLAYTASNLLLACSHCNRKKSTKFPLLKEEHRVSEPSKDISKEEPLIIDPTTEDPKEHLSYDFSDEVAPFIIWKTDKGKKTIECLDLNDMELATERKKDLYILKSLYPILNNDLPFRLNEDIKKIMMELIAPNRPFLGMKKAYIKEKNIILH